MESLREPRWYHALTTTEPPRVRFTETTPSYLDRAAHEARLPAIAPRNLAVDEPHPQIERISVGGKEPFPRKHAREVAGIEVARPRAEAAETLVKEVRRFLQPAIQHAEVPTEVIAPSVHGSTNADKEVPAEWVLE